MASGEAGLQIGCVIKAETAKFVSSKQRRHRLYCHSRDGAEYMTEARRFQTIRRENDDQVSPMGIDYLYRVPCLITMSTRCNSSMYRSASPRTATMSAYLPSLIVP